MGWTMPDRHRIISGPPPFSRVALVDPAGNTLIKNPEIAISLGVQLFVGQTGQLVRARSVEHDQAVTRDFACTGINAVKGHRQRALNVLD
jgi:hypothetical protein